MLDRRDHAVARGVWITIEQREATTPAPQSVCRAIVGGCERRAEDADIAFARLGGGDVLKTPRGKEGFHSSRRATDSGALP